MWMRNDLLIYVGHLLLYAGNIRVFCRCRPLSVAEENSGASAVVEFDPTRDNDLSIRTNGSKKQFKFDRVFTPANSQCKQSLSVRLNKIKPCTDNSIV
jgi:hypothetical protein